MKSKIQTFNERDLAFLNSSVPDEQKRLRICRHYLQHHSIKAAGETVSVAGPSAERLLKSGIEMMLARKWIKLALRTSVLCVRVEHLVDNLSPKTRHGLVGAGYLLVLDLCFAHRGKVLKARNLSTKSVAEVEKFFQENELSFEMGIDPQTERLIRRAAATNLKMEQR